MFIFWWHLLPPLFSEPIPDVHEYLPHQILAIPRAVTLSGRVPYTQFDTPVVIVWVGLCQVLACAIQQVVTQIIVLGKFEPAGIVEGIVCCVTPLPPVC